MKPNAQQLDGRAERRAADPARPPARDAALATSGELFVSEAGDAE